ncbi:hypothetical protein O181_040857 [Austropuccinia psidii MF-1]|uniref:Uncharacterized protein n=1 Tax=Austropuccinia psidii MF-1 TaxID=1389203 RepID=A0A9Q3DFN5_9BASI|nr:hypothetical protein [Austropuccinia psidii MF-1]
MSKTRRSRGFCFGMLVRALAKRKEITNLSQAWPRRSCHPRVLSETEVGRDIGFISSKQWEEGAATDQEVSFPRTTSVHQQSFAKVVVTRSDRESPLKRGTTPALHKRPTDSIVPKIFWEKGTSWIITKPFLTGSLSVVVCEIVTEEL